MAKARMLHNKISISLEVDKLPLPARLLFTWTISHADDDGRLLGDPKYIKATVVPLTNWPINRIKAYLVLMNELGLIHYWQDNGSWIIEFQQWKRYQSIKSDRYKTSNLPTFSHMNGGRLDTNHIQENSNWDTQSNINEVSTVEINKSEDNNLIEEEIIADEDSFNEDTYMADPHKHVIEDEGQLAAFEAWKDLEPDNPMAFYTTYLTAYHRKLPTTYFYQFVSEIKQDDSINNPGAVFNNKVNSYFENLKSTNE